MLNMKLINDNYYVMCFSRMTCDNVFYMYFIHKFTTKTMYIQDISDFGYVSSITCDNVISENDMTL